MPDTLLLRQPQSKIIMGSFNPALPAAAVLGFSFSLAEPGGAQVPGSFDCVMDPAQIIELSPNGAGVLDEVLVARGSHVEAGQPVARLDTSLEQAAVEILEARLESTAQIDAQRARLDFVNAQLERVQKLVDQNAQSAVRLEELEYEHALAENQLAQAESDRLTLLAELRRAEIALANRTVHSPVAGIVSNTVLSAGEYAGQERHVLEIAQLDPLKVEAFLPTTLFEEVKLGTAVEIMPEEPIGGTFAGKISAKDTVFDTASRTFGVQVTLPNPDTKLPAGQRCTLQLVE